MADQEERVEVVMLKKRKASVDGGPAIELLTHSRHEMPKKMAEQYVEAGDAIAVEDVKWTAKTPPAQYLEEYPGGKQATLARVILANPGLVEMPEEEIRATSETESSDSSDSSDDSEET